MGISRNIIRNDQPLSSLLIATLGSEPQVVTAAADLLLARGERLRQVWVIHTQAAQGPVAAAPQALQQDFTAHPNGPVLRLCPILFEDEPVSDIETPHASEAAFRTLYRLVREAKQNDFRVHLSIAGGRKNLAIYGMVAAQLLFGEDDCLWHLYSAGDFLTSKRLHPQSGDEVRLLPVPVLLRDYVSPALTHLKAIDDPLQALERIRQLDLRNKMEQSASFVNGVLTAGERRVVQLLVQEGLSDSELAARLSLSPRTVEQHLRSAYDKAATHWELDDLSRSQLIILLHTYFQFPVRSENREKPA